MTVIHLYLAFGDEGVVGIDPEGVVLGRIELDDGAATHAQEVVDRHDGEAQLYRNVDFNLIERVHILIQHAPAESRRTPPQKHRLPMITEELICVGPDKLRRADSRPVEWVVAPGLLDYPTALATMKERAAAIARGEAEELVWLVEHPPLYTSGTSAEAGDLLQPNRFPVYEAGRGGEYTYHGPGQRVVYLMLDLRERGRDVRCLVQGLEGWIADTLSAFNVTGESREGRIGVWVKQPGRLGGESKIAAIGVRVSKWVTTHGIAINVAPDLSHFDGIVPCGISDRGVTSLEDLGQIVSMPEVDMALRAAFERRFGPTIAHTAESLVTAA